MAIRKTINFLPEIFRSETNKKFLNVTLDQLISEPSLTKINGFVGRKFSTAYSASDNYLVEPTDDRQNYQLEPVVVVEKNNAVDLYVDYKDLVNKIEFYGGIKSNHDRLFKADYYNYDPCIDLDKLSNYSQYYWMPNGPAAITISAGTPKKDEVYTIGRSTNGYRTDLTGSTDNPELTLVRGATYYFSVLQTSGFWIQTEPGISGKKQYSPTISTRDISGVTNNGATQGIVSFTVPERNAQDHYLKNPLIDYIHYATSNTFSTLDGRIWAPSLSNDDPRRNTSNPQYAQLLNDIDGATRFPEGEFIVFVNPSNTDADWTYYSGSYVPNDLRRGIWKIKIVEDSTLYNGTYRTPRIRFEYVAGIAVSTRIRSIYGTVNAGNEFFKNTSGIFQPASQITAPLSTLYYTDGSDAKFVGKLHIVDSPGNNINVNDDIVGKIAYTSPSGVKFSNGMKVYFDDSVTPTSYQNKSYIVEGVGIGIKLIDFSLLVPVESELPESTVPWDTIGFDQGPWDEPVVGSVQPEYIVMHRASKDLNAWSRLNRWTHIDVLIKSAEYNNTVPDIIAENRARRPIIEFNPDIQLFNHGRIFLGIIDRCYDKIGTTLITDAFGLLTNRNPGDIAIRGLGIKEGQLAIFPSDTDPVVRSKVYKIEFIDQTTTTVFDSTGTGIISAVNGSTEVVDGTLAAQYPKTSFVQQIEPGTILYTVQGVFIGKVKNILNNNTLTLEQPAAFNYNRAGFKFNRPRIIITENKSATAYDSVVVTSGSNAKNSYWFNGTNWVKSQWKSSANQDPLFDVIDDQGVSFGNDSTYPKTNFAGCKVFGYTRGTSVVDSILGFSLKYSNTGSSLSDINFTNYFDTDSFTYKPYLVELKQVLTGHLRHNLTRDTYSKTAVWPKVTEQTKQYQHIKHTFDGVTNYFEIDVIPADETDQPNLKVFINNKIVDEVLIEIRTVGVLKAVYINKTLNTGDNIDIIIYSKQPSSLGYYQVPVNLEFNPQNTLINLVTLGQIQNHWSRILSNTNNLIGTPLGKNNSRDIGNFGSGTLLQHSASVVNAALFLNDPQINFINSLDFARREYQKFKNKFLELCVTLPDLDPSDPESGIETILSSINLVKTTSFPWVYSDMVPWGKDYIIEEFKILNSSNRTHYINEIFSGIGIDIYPGKKTSKAISVYLNKKLLTLGKDYSIGPSTPSIQLSSSLTIVTNDILTVKSYLDTDGNYIPETPTKLGLYPKFVPEIFTDNTYRNPVQVIQGHDGSLTPVFNDLRDSYLLELETRIYNNLKVQYDKNLFDIHSIIPGKFRKTEYSIKEYNQILTGEFLKWAGNNQLSFTKNPYFLSNDQFTWNYNQTDDTINSEPLLGSWRGIYKYMYDTDRPHSHPWEMLGLTEKPSWWNSKYGAAPYTSTNTILWTDLENGFNYGNNEVDSRFKRPGLKNIIPVDALGSLLPPPGARLVRSFNGTKFSQNFVIGDNGPVEEAWRRTSEFPFAVQRAMALMKPAMYFGLLFDTTSYYKDTDTDSYVLKDSRLRPVGERITINGEIINGEINRSLGYINWIHGYLTNIGVDPVEKIRGLLDNNEIKLGYKIAGYTDKKYLTALVEQFSPSSTNTSVIIPDENYLVHLSSGTAVTKATYSAVIVEKTPTGYSISGYDLKTPYFTVIPSEFNGSYYTITASDSDAVIFEDYRSEKIFVPYGYEFSNKQQVVDFLVSYQRYLNSQGFIFNKYSPELKHVLDWTLSAREFLTWSEQGWREGNILVLSPVSNSVIFFNENYIVDQITNQSQRSKILGPNFNVIPINEISVSRETNLTTVTVVSGQTIALAELDLVQKEHVLIFDNATVFNDIIYKPELGTRQYRIKLIGNKTTNWQGGLEPPGFIYNTGIVDSWKQNQDYIKGDIVRYKEKNYTAIRDIAGTTAFNFDYWSILDRKIDSGLSPNFAHNAQKFEEVYNVDTVSLDEDFGRFSTGLIGFRNRPFLENLGMDRTSQVKFYQGYIKEKGTKKSTTALFGRYFDNIKSSINLYEEWAVRVGEYGALRSNQSIELILDEDTFKANPAAFKLLNYSDESTDSIQTIRPNQLLNSPLNYRAPIFLNRESLKETETDIKTAGYVNYNDIDGTIFDISRYSEISSNILASLTDGYKLWVAKDFNEDWQVYQARATDNEVILLEYALDNKIKLSFKYDHGLQISDVFAIRNFDNSFNGFYQVVNTEEYNTVVAFISLALSDSLDDSVGIQAAGEFFIFDPCRYTTIADRDADYTKLPRNNGDFAWVDTTGNGHWAVYSYGRGALGNYSGRHSSWGIKNGSINLRTAGTPYHTHGNTASSAVDQHFNRIWSLRGGANVAAESEVVATGITGYWLNGVPVTAPSIFGYTPGDYLLISDYDYDLVYSDYGVLNKDAAGGLLLDSGMYSYNSFTFEEAWQTGIGTRLTKVGSAEIEEIKYLSGSLRHSDGHSKILGFANDGYPIYGPYGYAIKSNKNSPVIKMRSSYRFKNSNYRVVESCNFIKYPMGMFIQDYMYVDGSGTLDKHNGRFCVTPDYPNGTYAYFVTVDTNDKPVYPYVIGPTYYGAVSETVNNIVPGPGTPPVTYVLSNNTTWDVIRNQEPKVDLGSVGSMYLYNNADKVILERLDRIDPAKGKILGTALADIDFISSLDPAKYNNGSSTEFLIEIESHWGEKQQGTIWWDVDNLRYIDYEQDSLEYRIKHWGEAFPGSTVEVYEWVITDVLPSTYVSSGQQGTPKYIDDSAYVTLNRVDPRTGVIKTRYCYWVSGRSDVTLRSKTHSVYTIESMIKNPVSQGISYVAVLKDNSIMLYNCGQFLSGTNTALHIDYKLKLNEDIIHSEFELVQEGNSSSILNPRIEEKLIDSLVGADINGNKVPDTSLLPKDRLGLSKQPRQTLIIDRLKAVKNIINYVNSILIQYPITSRIVNKEIVYSDNFYAASTPPVESEYDYNVDDYTQLDYVPELTANALLSGKKYIIISAGTTNFVALGAANNNPGTVFTASTAGTGSGICYPRSILVAADANYNDYWSIYQKNADGTATLVKVQVFDTTNFWSKVDWYATGFNNKTKINYTVDSFYQTYTLSLSNNDVVKIRNNGGNLFELYQYRAGKLRLVGLQDGTIQLSDSLYKENRFDYFGFDSVPYDLGSNIELRYILKGLKEDVFVNDLAEYYNKFLFAIIEYVLSEQKYVDWIFKTSFVSIAHKFEGLVQTSSYIKDQQDLYRQYIEEVKPYRTKIREYNLNYSATDELSGSAVSDFDLPPYYDRDLERFRSPSGDLLTDSVLLTNNPKYKDWTNNHSYEVASIELAERSKGYLNNPDISIVGTDLTGTGAAAVSAISSVDGSINKITVINTGRGYITTPIVNISGTGYTPMSKYANLTISVPGNISGNVSSNATVVALTNVKNAVGSPRLYNGKVRKIKTVIRFDRVQYTSAVNDWQSNTVYSAGSYVSYQGVGYKNNTGIAISASVYFDSSKWTVVSSSSFNNANDRIMAYYQPTPTMIPKILNRLISGLDNPQANVVASVDIDSIISGGSFKGETVAPNLITVGEKYIITNLGNTNFVAMGAAENTVGVIFTATAAGSGTGKLVVAIGSSAFANVGGISSEDITVNGGAFISEILSHAPQELLPGSMFDSLNIRSVDLSNVGYRVFVSMAENRSRAVIASNVRTTLAQDLDINDTTITVTDGSVLISPVTVSLPGIIYVNGERIEYFVKSGNVLSNIRRSVGGTGAPIVHSAGTTVEAGNTPYTD
jgi:hypothetical protein